MAVRVALQRVSAMALPASAADVRRWVRKAAATAGVAAGEVVVRVVDEDEGLALNRTWRDGDHATNVLSFPAGTSAMPPGVDRPLGDLVLCAPVVAREAAEQRKPLVHHYAHLVVHGTLHLVGHDHCNDDEARRMESLEADLLAQWNIPDPYRAAPPTTTDGQP